MNEWLLDTGVLLWWLAADPRLSFIVRNRITQATTRVFVSVATAWEVASLARQGRLDLGEPPEICLPRQIALHRFLWLPLDARHVLRASALPRGTLDPYDRLLVAQAALEGLSIVSTDPRLNSHGVPIVEALERPGILKQLALMRARREPGRPSPRPIRRSGDELEGEAHADPTELRRLNNPSGAIEGGQGRVGERGAAEPGERGAAEPGEPDERAWAESGRRLGARPGGDCEPDPVVLRPVPRWNAFPWGGLSRVADGDE